MARGANPGERRGGRAKGVPNRRTAEEQAAIKSLIDSGILPLEIMLRVMRGDTSITDRQLQAAQAAAPFCHPRLATTTLNANLRRSIREFTDEELEALVASAATDGAADEPGGLPH